MARVAFAGLEAERDPLSALAGRLSRALAESDEPIIAFIDSPRWPSDCDCRVSSSLHFRRDHQGGRRIDAQLRAVVRSLSASSMAGPAPRLALFPTPRHDYFVRCIRDRTCKPHLKAIGRQLFGLEPSDATTEGPRGGAIFTRFMLSGFATYRALEAIGAATFEAYPDLQFRLWRGHHPLAPKSAGRIALANRTEILAALALKLANKGQIYKRLTAEITAQITTIDQADATILALSACAALDHGLIAFVEDPEEGRFALPLQKCHADTLGLTKTRFRPSTLTFGEAAAAFHEHSVRRG
ncbi:MAG TPA: DUF429 domain-containing protein [Candidatus Binataceae bacterium]|nr:DUF429 domain-containing protein [Candidatus Binataceae bacterium]